MNFKIPAAKRLIAEEVDEEQYFPIPERPNIIDSEWFKANKLDNNVRNLFKFVYDKLVDLKKE